MKMTAVTQIFSKNDLLSEHSSENQSLIFPQNMSSIIGAGKRFLKNSNQWHLLTVTN